MSLLWTHHYHREVETQMRKPHLLDYRVCKECARQVLHEISWEIDLDKNVYQEVAQCLKCHTEQTRELSPKEYEKIGD